MCSFSYDIAKAFDSEEVANWKRGHDNKLCLNSFLCKDEVDTLYSHLRYICDRYIHSCYYAINGSISCADILDELRRIAEVVSFGRVDVTSIAKLVELDMRRLYEPVWKLCELPAWEDVRNAFLLSEKAWRLFQTVYGNATNWYREGLPRDTERCKMIIEDYRKMGGEEYVELMLMGVPIEDIIGQPQKGQYRLADFPSAETAVV